MTPPVRELGKDGGLLSKPRLTRAPDQAAGTAVPEHRGSAGDGVVAVSVTAKIIKKYLLKASKLSRVSE
jgi:hypothetical protein